MCYGPLLPFFIRNALVNETDTERQANIKELQTVECTMKEKKIIG